MQLKWLEDFTALVKTRNYSRAAQLRHVTHPAFGRRIKALERWVGAPLVEPGKTPVQLTTAGEMLLETANETIALLDELKRATTAQSNHKQTVVAVATGRTLARTLFADWMDRVQRQLGARAQPTWKVVTREIGLTVAMLESGQVDLLFCYHHPVLSLKLSARSYMHIKVGDEHLTPVCKAGADGKPVFTLTRARHTPLIGYASSLALGQLVSDHLKSSRIAQQLELSIECDSADAAQEYALKGMGVAWLPWSLAAPYVKQKRLAVVAARSEEIAFEVRLYRPKHRLSEAAERVWQLSTA
jgi:DNA-binding transcriptional LysR family regulator